MPISFPGPFWKCGEGKRPWHQLGCLSFTWKFWWFHTESKWNKHISTAQPERSRNKRFVWKGCPLLPIGTFQPVNFVPFTSFLFFSPVPGYSRFNSNRMGFPCKCMVNNLQCFPVSHSKWKAHNPKGFSIRNFAYHYISTILNRWVFHVNGKQPWSFMYWS